MVADYGHLYFTNSHIQLERVRHLHRGLVFVKDLAQNYVHAVCSRRISVKKRKNPFDHLTSNNFHMVPTYFTLILTHLLCNC